MVARQPRRPRAEHVAVSRADAGVRRRGAGDAGRRVHAAVPRAGARRHARPGRACTSRTNRSTRPTRSRRAASRRRSRARDTSARRRSRCRSAGNAGQRRRGLRRRRRPRLRRCSSRRTPSVRSSTNAALYGANVTLVDGLITDAGRLAAEQGGPLGWYDVSTLKEPYRIEGKKTMAYELAEQMDWRWPDWIVYPTGGGTGHGRDVEGVRGDRAHRLGDAGEAAADGVRAGGALRADRPRVRAGRPKRRSRGKAPRRSPTACACRAPSATS